VAARAPRTPRANLTNIIFIYRSSPSQNCPDAFSTPKLMSGPILLTPGHTHARGHSPDRSKSCEHEQSHISPYVQMMCVSWGDPQITV